MSVVADFPTIMDGYVVRWYGSEDAANHHEPIISASRNGVQKHIPGPRAEALFDLAVEIHTLVSQWYDQGCPSGPLPWAHVLTHKAHFFGDLERLP